MKRAKMVLALLTVVALGACSTTQEIPEPAPATSTAPVSQEAVETTPAVEEAPTQEPAPEDPEDYDAGPVTDDDKPMTAEELEATGEPMDGDTEPENGYMTEEEAQTEFDQCIADNLGEELCQGAYEFNTMTKDEAQDMGDVINSPGYKCLADLQSTRPDLFGGDWFVDVITEDPEVLEDPEAQACVELNN